MLLYSQTVTLAGPYADFGKLARASLEATARTHGTELSSEGANSILSALRSVPAHGDVQPALTKLRARGFRLVALTNSTQSTVDEQLKAAGLHPLFENVLSVDRWQRFKPDPEVYRRAAQELGVSPGQMRMIAAHPWDLMGARAAGCKVAFVERTRGAWFPLTAAPEMRGASLEELAEQLISKAAQ